MIKSWHMRHFELLGYVLVVGGVLVPFFGEHLFGTVALSACTFVLLAGGGAVLLVLNRRSREAENGAGVATLFGNAPVLDVSPAGPQHSFQLQYSAPSSLRVEPLASPRIIPEAEVADLAIEYSHNDRDPITQRNKPLVVKNVTGGKDAYNVRLTPMESPHDKLRFNPEWIVRLAGGEQVEIVPEPGLLDGGYVRQTRNHLPDFVAGLYNTSGRTDIQALNEIYEERSLMLEIEYESEGKRMVSRCELLYTPWHRNIRTGKHTVRQAIASESI
jgi:hypothetical protein